MEEAEAQQQLPPSTLRRRNSISTPLVVPSKLSLHTSCSLPNGTALQSPALDLDLLSFKSSFASYTSLKDLLPSSAAACVNSPTAASASTSGYEISIRNRLVKQAAWAYLQPMSSSAESSGNHFLRRLWLRFSSAQNPLSACLRFVHFRLLPGIYRVFDQILRAIGIRVTR